MGSWRCQRTELIDDPYHQRQVLDEVRQRMRQHGIKHVTLQLEPRELVQVRQAGEVRG